MNHLGYYERAVGMGDEPSYVSRLGSTLLTGGLGAFVAVKAAEVKDLRNIAAVGGAVSAIGAASILEALIPLGGSFYSAPYWIRGAIVSGGAGAIVGTFLKNQHAREVRFATEMRNL